MASRILALAGTDTDAVQRLGWLRLFLIIHIGFELAWSVPSRWLETLWSPLQLLDPAALTGLYLAVAVGLCAVLYLLRPDLRSLVTRVVACLGVVAVAWLFEDTPNHYFLAAFCLVILALVDLDDVRESLLALQVLRIVTVAVLFFSGLQKIFYGTYYRAEFLTWAIANTERFAFFFGKVLPAGEFERIQALPAAGPFGSDWLPLVLASNGVWIFELLIPFFLLHPKTRDGATLATVLFLVAIEAGAQEWFFAFIFISLLMLLPRRDFMKWLVPGFLAIYAVALALAIGHGAWALLASGGAGP